MLAKPTILTICHWLSAILAAHYLM